MKARSALLFLFAILSLGLSVASAQENIFTVRQPDYQKSPYTGMARRHWIEAVFPETAGKDISENSGKNPGGEAGRAGTHFIRSCHSFKR